MTIDRRQLLRSSAATFVAFSALSCSNLARGASINPGLRLVPDPDGMLDLPEGFSYRLLTRTGKPMSDGFVTPGRPDGMACFAHPTQAGKLVLVRNHEMFANIDYGMPWSEGGAPRSSLAADKIYDARNMASDGGEAFFGGTTNVVLNAQTLAVEQDNLSLIGTVANCAGGATPWGSWLTCEEQMLRPGEQGSQVPHGFVFEVPAIATGLVDPVPLRAMGRFAHEAASVDPESGVVYLTEDHPAGLFYRFLPAQKDNLAAGGRLQALAIRGWTSADMRNLPQDWSAPTAQRVPVGKPYAVEWIDMEDVEAPEGDLRQRGHAAGAALFCRGEGMAYGARDAGTRKHFFNCTQGGMATSGQVWSYEPGAGEGTADEQPGTLTLIHESATPDSLDLCDNLAVSPWGDLVLCEDGRGDNYLRLLTPHGAILDFARNAHAGRAEFCGACFAPGGGTMFVNVQEPGMTYAITGPWETLR